MCALRGFENAERKTDGLIKVWFQEFVKFNFEWLHRFDFFQRGVVSVTLETNPVPRAPSLGGAIGGWGRRQEQRSCPLYKGRRDRGKEPGLIAWEAKNSVFFFFTDWNPLPVGSRLVYLGLTASRLILACRGQTGT